MDNVDLLKYAHDVATIVIKRFSGRIPQKDMRKFCETIMEIAKQLDNYKTSPEDVIELVNGFVMMARIDLQDICRGDLHSTIQEVARSNWDNKKYYIDRMKEISNNKGIECPEVDMKMTLGEIRDIYKELRKQCT